MQPSENKLVNHIRQMQPLIILGMHRSGTSLTTILLMNVGMHMGLRLSRDSEAVYFQRLNRKIFSQAGIKWGQVDHLIAAMESEIFIESQSKNLLHFLFRPNLIPGLDKNISIFFGYRQWQQIKSNKIIHWGWKDPRTTITFPIWLQIFPNAKFLHILRNGVDVAISIHRRSLVQQQKIRNRIIHLDFSPVTLNFEYSFRLWETYVNFVYQYRHRIPNENYCEIRYEDLLTHPESQLRNLANFAGISIEDRKINDACKIVNKRRLDNSQHYQAYAEQIRSLPHSNLMDKLNYTVEL